MGNLIFLGDLLEVGLGQRFRAKTPPKSVAQHSWGTLKGISVSQGCLGA